VFRLKPIYGDGKEQVIYPTPGLRDLSDGAGHKLDGYSHLAQSRQQDVQLAKAHEWFAADNGDVQRAVASSKGYDAIDQLVTLIIGERSQRPELMEVLGLESVAARTAQRALACDLDR
jgi:hypothetical protein